MRRRPHLWLVLCGLVLLAGAAWPIGYGAAQDAGAAATISALQTKVARQQTEIASLKTPTTGVPSTPLPSQAAAGATAGKSGEDRGHPAPLGQEAVRGDIALSVRQVARGAPAQALLAQRPYSQVEPPLPTQQYIVVRVKVRNVGTASTPVKVDGSADFQVTGSTNAMVWTLPALPPSPALEATDGGPVSLYPGGATDGWVVGLVGTGETNLELVYAPGYGYGNPDEWRYLALEQGARLPVAGTTAAMADGTAIAAIGSPPNTTGSRREAPAPRGQLVITQGLALRVANTLRGDAALGRLQMAGGTESPAAGNEYVLVEVQVADVGRADGPVGVAELDFSLTGSSGVVSPADPNVPRLLSNLHPANTLTGLNAYLFSGGAVSGWLLFEAKAGQTNLTLIYQPVADYGAQPRFLAAG